MKYISFAIPCYNSEAYMEKAINSILVGGEDVEIIVVNDGSKDGTQKIAERYQEKYPTIVKAVEKENGGHGDAVNCGLAHATGKYFKVVDSDDWVDKEALKKILDAVKGFVDADSPVDMVISNYVYEKVGMKHKKVIRYDNVLPQNQVFRWDDIGQILRHSGKTALLVTHDLSEAISLSDRIIVLSRRPATVSTIIPVTFSLEHDTPLNRRNAPEFKNYFNQLWKELNQNEILA